MAVLLPWISQKFTHGGKPLVGGKIWSYQAGTTTPAVTFSDRAGLIPNTNPVILNSEGEANIWLAPGNFKFVIMDRNDVVLKTIDNVAPADGGGGGIIDSDYVFDGYSARFSEQFGPTTGLMDTLNKIIKITYTAPAISLAASGSGTIREKGASVSGTTLTATVTKRSNPIAEVRFYRGATLIDTKTGTIPNGGSAVYAYATAFTDNVSFSARVDDTQVGDDGPTTVTSNTVTFNFVYPYFKANYAEVSDDGDMIYNNYDKSVIASTANWANQSFTVPSGGGQVAIAYPKSYGVLTSITDVNDFEVLPSWSRREETITGLDGTPQVYYVYITSNTLAAGNYIFSFKR